MLTSLFGLLRECFDLAGAKKGRAAGDCSTCAPLLDGIRVNYIMVLATRLGGAKVAMI